MPKPTANPKAMLNLAKRDKEKEVPMKKAVKPLVERAKAKGRKGC